MTDLRTVPLPRLPPGPVTGEQLQPWMELIVREVLSKADIRNAIGQGITISADGNVVATLDAASAISAAFVTHNADATANTAAIDAHEGATDPHPDIIDDLTAATAVAEADYVLVSQSGANKKATVEQLSDAVFGDDWTDLVIPAVGINPAGAAAPPTLNNATGCLEFSASADNVIILTWQLPHGWSGEYDATKAVVVPHLHVRHLTSTAAPNNVSRWKCEYDVADPFGNFTNAYGTFTAMATVSVTNPAATVQCGLIDLGDLNLAGYGASCILHCKISRLASTDGADTDSSVIALYSADLHFMQRRAGTENELPS